MMKIKYKYNSIKRTYQDIKSGIVKHSTRGSLDIITFDSNKKIIPFTSQDLILYEINKQRLLGIEKGLDHDNINYTFFNYVLTKNKTILNTEPNIFKAHTDIRDLLWKEIHCHPKYNRSIAFTFLEYQKPEIITKEYMVYKKQFISLLGEKMYNTNNPVDRQEVFRAMLRSYKEIDKNTAKKIKYMVNELNINIDKEFLHILSKLVKETLI